jgi:hypothetical protein
MRWVCWLMTTHSQSCSGKHVRVTAGEGRRRTCWTRRPVSENPVGPYRSRAGMGGESEAWNLGLREGESILCMSSQRKKQDRQRESKAYPEMSPRADRGSGGMQEDAETSSALRVPGKSMAIGLLLLMLGASLRKLEDLGIVSESRGRVLISITEKTRGQCQGKEAKERK